ncbi:5' nucleotidase, NT5C type [Brevibacillus borstelensis]|uniref:5' nucleotidase, NT5C type n=1 Tax=Brevibacillus borstelensis TaxID=45462 RepID=UPI0030C196CD
MKPERTLTIGIDIDGTVTEPSSIVPLMNESFGKHLRYEDCFVYNLAKVYDISDEAFADWLDKHGERLYDEAPVHGTADSILRSWFGRHRLIYISAREARHRDVTLNWFSRYQIPFHELDLIGSHDKLAAAQKWRVDLFLEDRLENALQLSEALEIPVLLFDTPYNQGTLPELVHRVHSWEQVDALVESLPIKRLLGSTRP